MNAMQVQIVETPHGEYMATCKGLRAEGSTATEAEENLLELLRMQWEERGVGHMPPVIADPDEVPDGE